MYSKELNYKKIYFLNQPEAIAITEAMTFVKKYILAIKLKVMY